MLTPTIGEGEDTGLNRIFCTIQHCQVRIMQLLDCDPYLSVAVLELLLVQMETNTLKLNVKTKSLDDESVPLTISLKALDKLDWLSKEEFSQKTFRAWTLLAESFFNCPGKFPTAFGGNAINGWPEVNRTFHMNQVDQIQIVTSLLYSVSKNPILKDRLFSLNLFENSVVSKTSPPPSRKSSLEWSSGLDSEVEPFISKSMAGIFSIIPEYVHLPPGDFVLQLLNLKVLSRRSELSSSINMHYYSIQRHVEQALYNEERCGHVNFVSFQRKLLWQEVREYTKVKSYAMYNVSLSLGVINFKIRRYTEEALDGRHPRSGPYAGPLLHVPEHVSFQCVILDVPGMPDGEPNLKIGSVVYVKSAQQLSLEFVTIVIGTHETSALLLVPELILSSLTDCHSMRWHISYAYDFEYYHNLHNSLQILSRANIFESYSWMEEGSQVFSQENLLEGLGLENIDLGDAEPQSLRDKFKCLLTSSVPLNKEQERIIKTVWNALVLPQEKSLHCPKGYQMICVRGPAGTGKSLTAAKLGAFTSALSTLRGKRRKVLVYVPQDYTADLICKHLMSDLKGMDKAYKKGFPTSVSILRVNDPSRPVMQSLDEVLDCCKIVGGMFAVPTPNELKRAHVVVVSSKSLWCLWRSSVEFDLTIIDEAGQASLSEGLQLLSYNHSHVPKRQVRTARKVVDETSSKVLVMFGDECQLGPSQNSLFNSVMYFWGNSNFSSQIFHLRKNYRSNASLIKVSKDLFYGSKLDAFAPAAEVVPPDISHILPDNTKGSRKGVPSMITIAIEGTHSRSSYWAKGKSCSNQTEATAVKDIVQHFIIKQIVSVFDISIIAFSRAQVVLIRTLLRKEGFGQIRCGTVDDFQGQQSNIVCISCVASDLQALDLDPKRFNVAITRARKLAMVVGSPCIFDHEQSQHWHKLASLCAAEKAYINMPTEAITKEKEKIVKNKELERLAGHAQKALLGEGCKYQLYPSLEEHHSMQGWGSPCDELSAEARVDIG